MNAPAAPANTAAKGLPLAARIKQQALGLLADFWKDPDVEFSPLFQIKLGRCAIRIPNLLKLVPAGSVPAVAPIVASATPMPAAAAAPAPAAPKQKWHAQPGEVAEKMWGEGNVYPAGDAMLDLLVKPLALTKDKNVLDLTAGLGGPLRRLVSHVGQLKGLEPDAAIAARGMEISAKAGKGKMAPVEAYDVGHFSMPAIYHCMIARELFYRVGDKGKFFYSIVAGIKEKGQIAFTDYILDPEHRGKPAVAAWQAYEKGAQPLGLIEMAEAWAKESVQIKASEDLTTMYRAEIVAGINRFVSALRDVGHPDLETKQTILKEVELWIHRLAAIQAGLKFYRFHAAKT